MLELNKIYHGKCEIVLKDFPADYFDSIVTDPPYGINFMGKKWDYDVPSVEIWQECLRVLKPGGYLLSFAGTRTQHRMACNIEDAGFEIRDMIAWVYGSGFPKSLDISKAIDKAAGFERKIIGEKVTPDGKRYSARTPNSTGEYNLTCGHNSLSGKTKHNNDITAPASTEAQQWNGWGTALKPALEPITMARKPIKGTVAANVLKYGTGGINIDGCRIGTESTLRPMGKLTSKGLPGGGFGAPERIGDRPIVGIGGSDKGRFPANLIHDGSDEVLAEFPDSNGQQGDVRGTETSHTGDENTHCYGEFQRVPAEKRNDSGSAARFFYCAKSSKKDRNGFNNHPTVKPIALMKYLIKLVTPPGGIVLDPFTGSGSTCKAAVEENFKFVGIEKEQESVTTANKRMRTAELSLF